MKLMQFVLFIFVCPCIIAAEIDPTDDLKSYMDYVVDNFETLRQREGFRETIVAKLYEFLSRRADVNAANDRNGSRVIDFFLQVGSVDDVAAVLVRGAKVNLATENGMTSMLWALRLGHEEKVRLLLKNGGEVTTLDEEGNSALVYAACGRNYNVVKLMLEKNIDPWHRNKNNETALDYLLRYDRPSWQVLFAAMNDCNELREHLNEMGKNLSELRVLYRYFKEEAVRKLMKLMEKHSVHSLNLIDDTHGKSAVHYLYELGFFKTMKKFVEDCAPDLNLADDDGLTLLMSATRNNDQEMVKFLLDKKVSLDLQHFTGYTALMFASTRGYNQIVELLLKAGASSDCLYEQK